MHRLSLKGAQLELDGKTTVFLLCWVAMRILLQESVIIQENVAQFRTELLQSWLGALYVIEVVLINPEQLGWPVSRVRKWTIMRHRYKTKAFLSPFNSFVNMFCVPKVGLTQFTTRWPGVPQWDVFFVASPGELAYEFEWASCRPQSLWQTYSEIPDPDFSSEPTCC